jgi:hypothetical protein
MAVADHCAATRASVDALLACRSLIYRTRRDLFTSLDEDLETEREPAQRPVRVAIARRTPQPMITWPTARSSGHLARE